MFSRRTESAGSSPSKSPQQGMRGLGQAADTDLQAPRSHKGQRGSKHRTPADQRPAQPPLPGKVTVCCTLCRQFHCHKSSHASIKRTFREIIPLQIYPQQLDGTSLQYVYRTQLKTGIQVVPHTTQDLPPQKAERKPPLKSVAARLGSNFLHMTVHSRSASIRFLKGNRAALQLSSC